MLDEIVSEINLSDEDGDVFRNGSKQERVAPVSTDDNVPTKDSSYVHFEPVVSKPFHISVDNPEKSGDGLSSYVVYHVHFEGLAEPFLGINSNVLRRFSEFIHMHEKLVARHLPDGIIVPPPPGKEVIGSTRLKLSKNAYLENEFLERRRLALKRFLTRLFSHPVLSSDQDLLDFIQQSNVPRTSTQLLSSTAAKRLIKNIGDAFGKASYKQDEPDDYFYAKTDELTAWERHLRRLRSALAASGSAEQELATTIFAESRAVLGLANVEEHTGLARILVSLSKTEEEISQVQATQANSHILNLVECVTDVLNLIQASRDAMAERVNAYRSWKNTEATIRSKREQKINHELSGKRDQRKLDQMDAELHELCKRMDSEESRFEEISKTLKTELEMLGTNRFLEIKTAAINHLEVMLTAQSKVLGYWQTYLQHVNSIN